MVDISSTTFLFNEKESLITIKPTGNNIIYGANIINKIVEPIKNPPTITSIKLLKLFLITLIISLITYILYRRTNKYILTK